MSGRTFGNLLPLSIFSSQIMSFSIYSRKKYIGCLSSCTSPFRKNPAPFMLKKQKGNHPELIYNEGNGNYLIQRFPETHSSNDFWNCFMLRTIHTETNVKWSHVEGSGVLQKVTVPFKNDWTKCFVLQLQWPAHAQLFLSRLYY